MAAVVFSISPHPNGHSVTLTKQGGNGGAASTIAVGVIFAATGDKTVSIRGSVTFNDNSSKSANASASVTVSAEAAPCPAPPMR